jgi:rhomboid protease GluP
MRGAPVTTLLLVAVGAVFVVEVLLGGSQDMRVLLRLGANFAPAVLQGGQWWRLVASMFLHIGIFHLLLNGWALFQLGPLVESWMGSLRLLVVYFAAGVAGSLASVLWRQEGLSAGASGAIFGLLGALITFLLRRHDRLRPAARSLLAQFLLWAGINVFFGFTNPAIDNAAHLGGFAAGLLLGAVLGEAPHLPRSAEET